MFEGLQPRSNRSFWIKRAREEEARKRRRDDTNIYAELDMQYVREEILDKLPLDEDARRIFCDILKEFYSFGHSGTTQEYTQSLITGFIDSSDEEIIHMLLPKFITADMTEEDMHIRTKMLMQVVKIVGLFRPLNEHKCNMFYKYVLNNLLGQQPMFMVKLDQPSLWVEVELGVFQHAQASNIFKRINPDETVKMFQVDYYAFEEESGIRFISPRYSSLDISDQIYWRPETTCIITKDTVQKFIDRFNEDGVTFKQIISNN